VNFVIIMMKKVVQEIVFYVNVLVVSIEIIWIIVAWLRWLIDFLIVIMTKFKQNSGLVES
jgi:hypothetical protein